jgi:hypothetical protein
MYSKIISWLESHTIPCFSKKIFGIDCPGCGLQSAFIELLKGNFIESIKIYPPLIPIILLFLLLILQLIFKFEKAVFYIKIIFIFTAILIIINYIIKVVNHLLI